MPTMNRYQATRQNPQLHQNVVWPRRGFTADDSFRSQRASGPPRTTFEGRLHGPGWSPWSLDTWIKRFKVREVFRIGAGQMPSSGCTFRSRPRVFPTGDFVAGTAAAALTDKPSAVLKMHLRQKIYNPAFVGASDWRTLTKYSIRNAANQHIIGTRTGVLGQPGQYWLFPEMVFELDRSNSLLIVLEVTISMELEGTGVIGFADASIRLPEWDIVEVR